MLNNLYKNPSFNRFSMDTIGPRINHLAYADDLIIFCSGKTKTLELIVDCLRKYEESSGQQMNKGKSCFIMDKDISIKRINIVSRILQVKKEEFLITYLGCPLFTGKKKNEYFADMATKIVKKIGSWQCKRLSTGGKITLIKHVLNTMPIYLLSMCQPTKIIIYQIEKIFANFL